MRGGWVERGTVMIRLTRPHFAFFRGYLDNLDLGMLARRYLENVIDSDKAVVGPDHPELGKAAADLRVAKSSLNWIREQLAVAARRSGNTKSIRLLRLPPEKLHVQYASHVPTLEEFRDERDPYDVYTEEELIALFQEEYGSGAGKLDRRVERNARLRARQRIALNQLEELVSATPKLSDGVDGWIDPVLAKRLQAAGILTLGDLTTAINGFGYRWYTKVPKVGEKAAAQIVKWLTTPDVANALGATLHARGLRKKRDLGSNVPAVYAPRTAIVPLEHFKLPSELDGSHGTNRGDRSLLAANNDLQAIHAWLGLCKPDSHTYRSYRKEAERFLLWAILEKGKPISSLSVEDCRDYRDFLWYLGATVDVLVLSPALPADGKSASSPSAVPTGKTAKILEHQYWSTRFRIPQEQWIGKRGTPRWSEFWRPFEGKLSDASQTTALVIVQSLLQWLTDQHYLHGNPMTGVNRLTKRADKIDTRRALSKAEWKAVKAYLETLKRENDLTNEDRAHNDKYYRLRFILALAYSTGMRLSEMARLRKKHIRSFVRLEDGATAWEIEVLGKGDKKRTVQITRALIQEIHTYFIRRGHESFAKADPETPLIAALPLYDKDKNRKHGSSNDPLSEIRLYEVLKAFFEAVARTVEDSEMADNLARASTHWLRHTYATHALEAGMSLEVVRDLLGHASLDTTSVYINAERDRSSKEAEELGPAL